MGFISHFMEGVYFGTFTKTFKFINVVLITPQLILLCKLNHSRWDLTY